jgi:DMSO/TMAO reductase YedYZ heme-binding membrane subunit
MAARNGNEAVLLAIVNKIGAGMVQIVQNKKSKNGWTFLFAVLITLVKGGHRFWRLVHRVMLAFRAFYFCIMHVSMYLTTMAEQVCI